MPAITDQQMSPDQINRLTHAMLSVALQDGLHPSETEMIRQFYAASRSDDMPSVQTMMDTSASRPFDINTLAGSSADFAETVVLMCLMAGYADGNLADGERAHIKAMADVMGVADATFSDLLAKVHDDLIGALSHLPDSGSVAKVLSALS